MKLIPTLALAALMSAGAAFEQVVLFELQAWFDIEISVPALDLDSVDTINVSV